MEASEDFESRQKGVLAALVAVNRTVNGITAEDLTFERTVNPAAAEQLDASAARLIQLSSRLLMSAASATSKKTTSPSLDDAEDVDLNWTSIVDVIDGLLEKADTTLDEYAGLLKRKDAPTSEAGPDTKKSKPTTDKLEWSIRRANIAKPQDMFEHKPDNFDKGPWKPLLTAKPNASVPLADSLTTFVTDEHSTQYTHPYEKEITEMKYPEAVYHKREPVLYQPTETTAAVWVDTFEGVEAMLEELREADEIAVDLEHHDYRTYTGLLSLMQISTRKKDWVVDTLKPWRHRLEILNEVFTDPTKIKVFHGATSDIVWLQRDLGLYIVGLFDTYFASECLEYPARSLAYLLKRFVDFDADKKYQMADWRIRPLSEEMLYYARSDTHFLLYVFDMVRNELADKSDPSDPDMNLTEYVLQKSKETALQRYENALCDSETGQGTRGWFHSLVRSYMNLSGEQFAVYRALFQWRDDISRAEDESPGFIMPMRSLADIARIMPPDRKALWSLLHNCARPTKSKLDEIFDLVQSAKASGADGPTSADFLRLHPFDKGPSRKGHGPSTTTGASALPAPPEDKELLQLQLPAISELRSNFSQLWGSIPITGKKELDSSTSEASTQVEAPWFSFVQAAVTGVMDTAATPKRPRAEEYIDVSLSGQKPLPSREVTKPEVSTSTPAEAPLATQPTAPKDDEIFTMVRGKPKKDRQGKPDKTQKKSKRERNGKTPATGGKEKDEEYEQDEDGEEESADSEGGAPLHGEDGDTQMEDAQFVPFNYDTAPSAVHAKNADKSADKKNKKKKTFNPHAKSTTAEGPKAARRMHHEKVGKTATFKK